MWSIMLSAVVLLSIALGVLFTRRSAEDRRRHARWNNLHERGKLIGSQLAHFKESAAQKHGAASPASLPDATQEKAFEALSHWPKCALQQGPGNGRVVVDLVTPA